MGGGSWSQERFRELANAEEEALLDATDGLLACSPELWKKMNTAYVVVVQTDSGVGVDSIWWDKQEALTTAEGLRKERRIEASVHTSMFQPPKPPPKPKLGDLLKQEARIFPAEET